MWQQSAGKPEVMVVDDQTALIGDVVAHLEPSFGSIAAFTDPVRAAEHLRGGERYKSILMDVQMEPLNGLALLKLARELDESVRVIMISGSASVDSAIKAMQLGAVDYILKPVTDWQNVTRVVTRAVGDWDVRAINMRLMNELKTRNEDLAQSVFLLKKLNETSEMMHIEREVKSILNLLLKAAQDGLGAQRVSIMIRDPKQANIAVQVAVGIGVATLTQVEMSPEADIAGQVLTRGQAIVVDDATRDGRVTPKTRVKPYEGRSFMSIPIIMRRAPGGPERVMGVVNVTDRQHDRPFSQAEVEFVTNLGSQAALALTGAAAWQSLSTQVKPK